MAADYRVSAVLASKISETRSDSLENGSRAHLQGMEEHDSNPTAANHCNPPMQIPGANRVTFVPMCVPRKSLQPLGGAPRKRVLPVQQEMHICTNVPPRPGTVVDLLRPVAPKAEGRRECCGVPHQRNVRQRCRLTGRTLVPRIKDRAGSLGPRNKSSWRCNGSPRLLFPPCRLPDRSAR